MNKKTKKILGLFLAGMVLITFPVLGQAERTMGTMEVRSSAFGQGGNIPSEFTCDGADLSPPIEWSGVPADTQSLAIIVEDPDAPAGDWTHWLVYDLSPDLKRLPVGISSGEKLLTVGSEGRTDFGRPGYHGPCPPNGEHRYFFRVYALDAMLHLKPGVSKQELFQVMQGHVLAEGVLMGKYDRS